MVVPALTEPGTPRKRYCLQCRGLELRLADDGKAVYWCLKKCRAVGSNVLGREACSDYEPWRPFSAKGDE